MSLNIRPSDPNQAVTVFDVADDGLCQHNSSPVSDVVRLGQEAMARKRRSWDDWLLIADALQAGRTEVVHALHTNETHGRRFEKAMVVQFFCMGRDIGFGPWRGLAKLLSILSNFGAESQATRKA